MTPAEIERLEQLGNSSSDWAKVEVSANFSTECVRNSCFDGCVRIGEIAPSKVSMGLASVREGIYNSLIADCTIGDHPAIHHVKMLSGYTIGNHVVLFNVEEMVCSADPKSIAWLEPMNENGGRRLLPFAGMTIGDAYFWARYRGYKVLMDRLEEFTYEKLRHSGGCGQIGDYCVVKNSKALRNVTVRSMKEDPSTIDGCVLLADGVVGYGCTVEHGVIAARFLLGEHVHLEFGLRLNDTVVGDNSTLARCEIGNSMIFPAHEQHHNNSFLIAALVMGQSNVAAGGTIGSNHNSRTADGEISAARGFWPGLCCSFKHSSRFASYCLLAKGDYPAELDIKLPFALVNNNVSKDCLEVMPAYWWRYNMYAMDRNSKKFAKRDKRVVKAQHIEFDNLAPDTAEEILQAVGLLKQWIAESKGRDAVYAKGMEKSKRPTLILHAEEGIRAYEEMLVYYAVKSLECDSLKNVLSKCGLTESAAQKDCAVREAEWVNIGGQIVAKRDMEQLIAEVEKGSVRNWDEIHERMDAFWKNYPAQRVAHAYGVLCQLAETKSLTETQWHAFQEEYRRICSYIEEQKVASRQKDDANPFRRMTYWDDREWDSVMA